MNSIETDAQFDDAASYFDETVTYAEVSDLSDPAAGSSSLASASGPWGGRNRCRVLRHPGQHFAAQ